MQAVILQLLDRLRREDSIGLFFVSHDLNVVRMLCEHLVVLQAGQVVEAGPSATVFAEPSAAYTRLLLDAIPYFEPRSTPPLSSSAGSGMAGHHNATITARATL